jgi:hypothetical protein
MYPSKLPVFKSISDVELIDRPILFGKKQKQIVLLPNKYLKIKSTHDDI